MADVVAAMTGAKELFYVSKDHITMDCTAHAEALVRFLLKPAGICNIVAVAMMVYQTAQIESGHAMKIRKD